MNTDMLSNIPRLYTAFAEFFACMVYISLLKKRIKGIKFYFVSAIFLIVICGWQLFANTLPIVFWIPSMAFAVLIMFLQILFLSHVNIREAGYICVRAFVVAELTASIGWQLYYYLSNLLNLYSKVFEVAFTLAIYSAIFMFIYWIEKKHISFDIKLYITQRDVLSSVLIAITAFTVSNISFVSANTPISSPVGPQLLYIRTLVDLCGFIILYAQQEQRQELRLREELEAMESVFNRQFDQYNQYKQNLESFNFKHHDLKHQLDLIRFEVDPQKQSKYLDKMESDLNVFTATNNTGNSILDTVLTSKMLYCQNKGINLSCVADGALLNDMELMDICTIFGNALDNAIENVLKIKDKEKRLIKVALYGQNQFIMMSFENYYTNKIQIEDGLPITTKTDKRYHGYGLKSIRYTAEKYNGSITVNTKDNWFVLRVLIPMGQKINK